MLTCDRVFSMLSDYLDGELPGPTRRAFEQHVGSCDRCAQFGREFETVVKAIRAAKRPRPSDELLQRLDKLTE